MKIERIHAFDSIRAIMMILGVFIHTALTYSKIEYNGWPLFNPNEGHLFFDWLFGIIHIFRMPIFFIISGFFGALLFYKKSPYQMISNRINRVLLPFIAFIFILTPLNNIAVKYSAPLFLDENQHILIIDIIKSLSPHNFLPYKGTYHLWFLYYLIMFSLLTTLLYKLIKTDYFLQRFFNKILSKNYLSILILSIITYVIIYTSGKTWIDASISFIPDPYTFTFHLFFYIFGWMLFISKKWMEYFLKSGWKDVIIGLILFSFLFIAYDKFSSSLIILINSLAVWFFCFGFFGVFIRHLNTYSSFLKYICDSSYWIYLLHLPLTLFLPGLLVNYSLPIGLKFFIVVSITLILCVSTYHILVRKTFIGKFLNGRKFID